MQERDDLSVKELLPFVKKNSSFAKFYNERHKFLSILVTETFFLYLLIRTVNLVNKKKPK